MKEERKGRKEGEEGREEWDWGVENKRRRVDGNLLIESILNIKRNTFTGKFK